MNNTLEDVSASARRINAPIDEQVRLLNLRIDGMKEILVKLEAGQSVILERLTDIETDRKLVGAATVAAIIISSLALITSIVAVIAAFTIR